MAESEALRYSPDELARGFGAMPADRVRHPTLTVENPSRPVAAVMCSLAATLITIDQAKAFGARRIVSPITECRW
jgi:putative NIF3 family GTP cyclohydrolase 1 type 2